MKRVWRGRFSFRRCGFAPGRSSRGCAGAENGDLRVGQREHFGTEAGSSHAEQENVGECAALYFIGESFQFGRVGKLLVGDAEPSQPTGFVVTRPERGVTLPEPSYFSRGAPVVKVFFTAASRSAEGKHFARLSAMWSFALCSSRLRPAACRRRQRIASRRRGQLVGHIFHDNADRSEIGHRFAGGVEVFGQTLARLAVIAEGIEGCRRNGVDGVGPINSSM